MEEREQKMMIKIMEKELIPALGCTEPVAFGLCAASARKYAPGKINEIVCEASSAMLKGVEYVKIPKSNGLTGGKMASAMGAVGGNSEMGLEVFHSFKPEDRQKALDIVNQGIVKLKKVDSPFKLYLKTTIKTDENTATAIIQEAHNNVAYIELNGKIIKDTREKDVEETKTTEDVDYSILNVPGIYEFCKNAPLSHLSIIEKTIELTRAIAVDGMNNPYGMEVGRTLKSKLSNGIVSSDLAMNAVIWTAAGVDARMGGSSFPAMSNSGSGNQGITCTMPVIATGDYLKKSKEEILRAVALSNLLTIFVKTHYDPNYARMSPVCCAAVAAGSGGCGIAYLLGTTPKEIEMILQSVLGNVAGLFCDGAKANCALKVAMTIHSAIHAYLLAKAGFASGDNDGLVGKNIEETITNFFRIQREGMSKIEEVTYNIESEKKLASHEEVS
jgi:L-cysteine desulfidase